MDADSTPPLKIHLPTGSSVPIRAPLTIDSDSEFCLSINDQICSRTSSFNSTSSIDVSSYVDDEHVTVLEENDIFVAHPDEKMVIESCRVEQHSFTIPFVKYPNQNFVKSSSHFDKSAIFRPFVKTPHQESRVGVPIAPLTSDCDSDNDSLESHRSLSSDGIPADGTVQKVAMAPKVGVFCSSYEGDDEVDDELQFDDVFSGDDIRESNEPITGYVRDKTIDEDEGKIEGLNEVVKISEMDEIGHYEQKEVDEDENDTSDSHIVAESDNEIKIEIETIDEIEQGVFDRYGNEFEKTNEKEEEQREEDEDDISFDSQRIDAQIIPDSDNEIEIENINGIGQEASTDAFRPGTTTVQEIVGKIDGIRVRILDTPGLRDSPSERSYNLKILASVKRFTRKRIADIVLYVDRLDTHSRDLHDSHLLRLITSSLGSLVWQNCIVVLTHAANSSSLPNEQSGGFVFQRCRFIQEQIVHVRATGQQTANPVWLVENQNHPSYKHDRNWQTRFLLLCYSAKILHEASSVVEPSLNSLERYWFEFGDCLGHVIDLDAGLEGLMGSARVWPVEPLGKPRNGGKLSKERKKAYFEDHNFRVKVFGKKRWSLVCRLHF
ncbi:hypothetical protein L6452_32203 [Arctium lappa]|uniref:Uncharacterized protein n=1 Tax=Arctium lappa TaxID=4217 RepID=A0ACB8Z3Z8_ARCLA|nr:hypothetical protein L6452_32203 [Arctium lappa]